MLIDEVSTADKQLYRGKSLIDPTKTHLNKTLYEDKDVITEVKDDTYRKADAVIAYEQILTYPVKDPPKRADGTIIEPLEFFETQVKIMQENEEIRSHLGKLIGCYVHLDETTPHMHTFHTCIEALEKEKSKVVGTEKVEKLIKKTGEIKTVERRIIKKYMQHLNSAKMMDRQFFADMHYLFEKAFEEKGVMVHLISDEVRAFNDYKQEMIEGTKKQIEKASTLEEKEALLSRMFDFLKARDPKKSRRAVHKLYQEEYEKKLEELRATYVKAAKNKADEEVKEAQAKAEADKEALRADVRTLEYAKKISEGKIKHNELTLAGQKGNLEFYERQVKDSRDKNTKLNITNKRLKEDNDRLTNENTDLVFNNEKLSEQVTDLTNQVSNLTEQIDTQNATIEEQKEAIQKQVSIYKKMQKEEYEREVRRLAREKAHAYIQSEESTPYQLAVLNEYVAEEFDKMLFITDEDGKFLTDFGNEILGDYLEELEEKDKFKDINGYYRDPKVKYSLVAACNEAVIQELYVEYKFELPILAKVAKALDKKGLIERSLYKILKDVDQFIGEKMKKLGLITQEEIDREDSKIDTIITPTYKGDER